MSIEDKIKARYENIECLTYEEYRYLVLHPLVKATISPNGFEYPTIVIVCYYTNSRKELSNI